MLRQNMNWNDLKKIATSKVADALEEKLNWNQELLLGLSLLTLVIASDFNNDNIILILELIWIAGILTEFIH
jgi:hypothetical protein